MENRPLRFGILGTGDGARNHARGFRFVPPDIAVLASVCGRDLARTEAFVGDAGSLATACADQPVFLADSNLDVVIVATPDALHVPHALAAMRAGKHVLVEKPLALSVAAAQELQVANAMWPDIRVGVGFHLRHHEGHRRLRDILARGAMIGAVAHIHLEWTTSSIGANSWRVTSREGWFALAALGSHALDLVRWLAGSDRANVFATKGASATGRDERVALHLDLDRGVTASIRVSVDASPTKYLRISGSNGVIECRDTLGGRGGGTIQNPLGMLFFPPVNPYAAQLVDFAAAVREGRDPVANVRDGVLNVRWLEQADQSMNCAIP